MSSRFGFHFADAGLSRSQGATSSDEEHFRGTTVATALVRELGQNSLDAADEDSDGPVRMVFELAQMRTSEIPDFDNLRRHVVASDEATRLIDKKNTRLKDAAEALNNKTLFVLRVGDYGTKGLSGQEGKKNLNTPLVALTRGAGISADKDGAGGSFGVGSSVGTLASEIHTVLWTSMPKGEDEVVFAAYCQLATHSIGDSDYQADGFFTDLSRTDDFHYLRSPGPVGPFETRKNVGTDTYILGYRLPEVGLGNSPVLDLSEIRDAFVSNFMVAIDRGNLVVEGIGPDGSWTLNKDTLPQYIDEVQDARPFYNALKDPNPIVKVLPGLGEVKLYTEFDDSLTRKLHTMTVRKPLMRITTFKHNVISAKYAAILECSDDEGNQLLRDLESPRHDNWESTRASHGKRTLRVLKDFVRDSLRERVKTEIGDEVKIEGLSQYLPAELGSNIGESSTHSGAPEPHNPTQRESSMVQGRRHAKPEKQDVQQRSRVSHAIRTPAQNQGGEEVQGGRDSGGAKHRKATGGNLDRTGSEGDGSSSKISDRITMRSWTDPASQRLILLLKSTKPVTGDIELCALGAGGRIEEDFVIPIRNAEVVANGSTQNLKFEKNTLKDVSLVGTPASARVQLELETSRRFRLGVI